MSKAQKIIKQTNVKHPNVVGHQIEHSETVDDNLLPDAAEIERLHKIDPSILDWLKKRAEQEQTFRHEFHNYRADLIHDNERNNRLLNTMGLIFAFLIFMAGMGLGFWLINKDHTITGTIFSGGTLLAGAGMFINRKYVANKQKEPPPKNN